MSRVKVLVIDDSAFMRKLISDLLLESPSIDVIGTAKNGKEGIEKIAELDPDVVTLDIEMPVLNGLDTLQIIMDKFPRPVIMLSSSTKEGAENTIKSLAFGAFDFIPKPSGSISLDIFKVKEELIAKVLAAKRAKEKVQMLKKEIDTFPRKEMMKEKSHRQRKKSLIAIGTSTGGPSTLQKIVPCFPKNLNSPIFIVQHMPPGFTKSLAERLNEMSNIEVKEGEHQEIVRNGVAYIAPGGSHMKVMEKQGNLFIELDQSEKKRGHRPSVDVLFESLSNLKYYHTIACILTGMGSDGTKGLKALKERTDATGIAQSEKTSIIFGMPKSAIQANVVDYVEDLMEIPYLIQKLI
ncbi:protein-glutamate methylesterase/protein-glutamine glutaminase [Aeribacillus sp. FSL M8-0254]|uniref:protein-glutamate methylesterase/protein-glutamine glutaminase n=1 Tax=Aeribacillus sp. FSL M8-0254 TaxID=2954577 RepID=UPI0030F70E1B